MDPSQWSNYQQYSRLTPGGLSAPHSAFPLLDQASLGSSLGLTHSLQPHAPLPQRALGSIPGVNYAHHSLHTSAMSQIIESMNPLTSSFNAQSLHKAGMNLSQNPLVFESVRTDQQVPMSSARFSSAGSAVFSPAKSSLFEDHHKDSYSSPSVVSQNLETGSRNWGLSNFMQGPSNPFGSISSVDLSNTLSVGVGHRSSQPPPAHSSGSRHSAIQRNPYSGDETPTRIARVEVPVSSASQVHSLYNSMMGIGRQIPSQQMDFHGMGSHEIEDLSSGSQQNHMYAAYSMGSSSSTATASYAASQLAADINYDPVSPATPLSENQPGETAFPTTVSFADLNAIGAGHHHKSRHGQSGLAVPDHKDVPSHLHPLMMPQPASRGRGSKSQQLSQGSVNSPHQHSPISVGSPQAPMSSMGSPQNVMPSSTVKASAPPVQAMADSSTPKPKKPRNRKKPKEQIQKNMPPPPSSFNNAGNQQQAGFMSSSQAFSSGNYPNNQMMGSQYSSSASPNNLGNYQVLSNVNNQESPRSQHQQQNEGPTLITLGAGARMSPLKGSGGSEAPMLSGSYQDEQDMQQTGQFDLQAFSTQPYMEQLVSGQSVRLIPGNVYSEAMHVAAGMPVFPGPYAYQAGEGSTIDEAAFSSLFDSGSKQEAHVMENPVVAEIQQQQEQSPAKQTATCTNPVDQDDELCNFARPPPELADKNAAKPQPGQHQPVNPAGEKSPEIKPLTPAAAKTGNGFQDSFMNFLMGKKQETLSSVTSATIGEKPQLPKYIPEPRRPPPPPPPRPEPNTSSIVSFSDDEEDSTVGVAVKNALNTLGQDSDSYESDSKETGYSVQRGTKDLTVKITLQNTLKKQQSSKRGRPPGIGRGRGRGDASKSKSTREPTPPPPRESIGRRAKDAVKKKKKYRESDTDEEAVGGPPVKRRGSGSEYDSDKDPVWTPFDDQEPKRLPTFGFDTSAMFEPKSKKSKKKKKRHEGDQAGSDTASTSVRVSKMDVPDNSNSSSADSKPVHTMPADEQQNADVVDDENFQVGRFLLEKKDLHNYESYPIWRLEQGRMMRKFEITIENGRIFHKSVSTYSSWVPSMRAGYIPIRVVIISNKTHGEVVEVVEECRPKPPTDGSLEAHYEDDPLVDHFNVYLQIFLSQALEPSFLSAIRKSQEYFYLVPLEKIDKSIEQKLEEIDKIVQWKTNFRECMRMKPQMREINRPNLKQSCQACENSSPPTIKSVLFHGSAYDRFLLTDLPNSDSSSQEFLVGKHAAPYVTQYHNLHHFKYRLYQRCRAKVHMVRESNKSQNIKEESILDQCLQNRNWVLKIFEDFKTLLER